MCAARAGTEHIISMSRCDLCSTESGDLISCEFCNQVSACSVEELLQYHRPVDQCLPFKVRSDPAKGRILVASRDVAEAELVMVDRAAAIVPCEDIICVGCFKPLEQGIFPRTNGHVAFRIFLINQRGTYFS